MSIDVVKMPEIHLVELMVIYLLNVWIELALMKISSLLIMMW
jgi:hypothetical protein